MRDFSSRGLVCSAADILRLLLIALKRDNLSVSDGK